MPTRNRDDARGSHPPGRWMQRRLLMVGLCDEEHVGDQSRQPLHLLDVAFRDLPRLLWAARMRERLAAPEQRRHTGSHLMREVRCKHLQTTVAFQPQLEPAPIASGGDRS